MVSSEEPEKENFLDALAGGNPEQVHQALEELFDGFFESQEFKDVATPVTEPEPEIGMGLASSKVEAKHGVMKEFNRYDKDATHYQS